MKCVKRSFLTSLSCAKFSVSAQELFFTWILNCVKFWYQIISCTFFFLPLYYKTNKQTFPQQKQIETEKKILIICRTRSQLKYPVKQSHLRLYCKSMKCFKQTNRFKYWRCGRMFKDTAESFQGFRVVSSFGVVSIPEFQVTAYIISQSQSSRERKTTRDVVMSCPYGKGNVSAVMCQF